MRQSEWWVRLYAWACGLLYAELAWSYDIVAWMVSLGRWGSWRRIAFDFLDGPTTLELGSGPGHLLVEGARRGLRMVGVDASPQMVARVQRRIAHERQVISLEHDASVVMGRGQQLPLAAGSMHNVVATFPAPYILEKATLDECQRVLDPHHGKLVVVGLWVATTIPVLRSLPVFYGRPSAAVQSMILKQFNAAGFRAEFLERPNGVFAVGVVVGRLAHPQRQGQSSPCAVQGPD